ncbi:hypothetical protein TD95_000477 [Thielaviopsis punctulata]|uniref:PLAC8 family protein n=1 Tax=Thielaviopsis punctulata TaxID=72032 RepID=A0A0F4ZA71_9PEZI|nr:hypothetical protein TD95_000477 [Thielaviopsis punctulata]
MEHNSAAPKSNWSSSLWDCFSPFGDCFMATCCPCVLLGKTSTRMRDPSMQSYSTVNTDCMLSCGINCLTGCGWIYAMLKRTELRERHNIEGSVLGDCCATFWCSCCVLVQSEKEAKYRTQPSVPNADGYQPMPKDGMVMPGSNQ